MMTTITHPQLPKIKGFHWKRIREHESCDGGILYKRQQLQEPGAGLEDRRGRPGGVRPSTPGSTRTRTTPG